MTVTRKESWKGIASEETLVELANSIANGLDPAMSDGSQKTQIVGATGNVAVVTPANAARAATDKVILVQTIASDGTIGSGSSAIDDATFDDGSDKGTVIMGVTGAADIAISGHQGAVGMTLKRELTTHIADGSDVTVGSTIDDKNASIDVTPATQIGILKYLSYLWQGVITAANSVRSTATKVLTMQLVDPNGYTPQVTSAGLLKVLSQAVSHLKTTHSTPNDGQATYLGVSSLQCTNFDFTVDSQNCSILSIGVTDVNNKLTRYSNGENCSISSAANVIYIYDTAGVALSAFAATDLFYKVAISQQDKAYDPSTGTYKVIDQSPDRANYVQDSLLDTTNVAAATGYYPSATGMSMDGFKDLSISGYIIQGDAVTDTIEVQVTNDEDPTDTTAWITTYAYSPKTDTNINIVTTGGVAGTYQFLLDFDNLNYTYFRIKLVTGDSTNTINIKSRRK